MGNVHWSAVHCIVNKKKLHNMSYMRVCAAAPFKSKPHFSYCGTIITFIISSNIKTFGPLCTLF